VFFPLRDSIPSSRFALVNWMLILINVGVFYHEISLTPGGLEEFVARWSAIPVTYSPLRQPTYEIIMRLPNLITSIFLHGSPAHLMGNMLFLWIFGDNIEDRLGHVGYVLFYLTCGVTASVAQIVWDLDSTVPMIGASGAIGGVMGAYVLFYPHSQVLTMLFLFVIVRFIWVPAIVYLGVWFLIQVVEALAAEPGAGAGVAFWAHVGGFTSGLVWALLAGLWTRMRSERG
jgi:membrane associated rhomboid family serine protease